MTHLSDLGALATRCARDLAAAVEGYADLVRGALAGGGTVFFAGNGGSAAHAQHIATEYVIRYRKVHRRAAAALALSSDSMLLTAAGNDLGFEQIFSRQLEAHASRGDLLVVVSTSGNSPNLVRAVQAAQSLGLTCVGLLASGGGALARLVDHAVVVPTDDTALAQEIQLAVDHHVCALVEATLL